MSNAAKNLKNIIKDTTTMLRKVKDMETALEIRDAVAAIVGR